MIKKIVYVLGLAYVLACTILYTFWWYSAYFNPLKEVLFTINQYREANVEFFIVTFFSVVTIISLIFLGKEVKNG